MIKDLHIVRKHSYNLIRLVCISLFLAPAVFAAQDASGEPADGAPIIRYAYGEFPPLSYTDKSGRPGGVLYRAVHAIIVEELGYRIEATSFPWRRAQSELEQGKVDFIVTAPTASRLKYAVISRLPIQSFSMNIYTYVGHPKLARIKSIKTTEDIKRLGLSSIANLGNGWHKEHIEQQGVTTIIGPKDEASVLMLAAKRGDVLIEFAVTNDRHIRALKLDDAILKTDVVFEVVHMHLMVGKRSKLMARLDELNEIIGRFRREGRFEEMKAAEIR